MRNVFLALLIFVTAPLAASANDAINASLSEVVRYQACSTQQVRDIHDVLKFGLGQIGLMNPKLLANRLEKARGRTALFDCNPTTPISYGAAAETKPSYEHRELFGIKITKSKLQPLQVIAVGKLLTSPKPAMLIANGLLHEFLHFLLFDNMDVQFHNTIPHVELFRFVGAAGNPAAVQESLPFDVVYSCASAAIGYYDWPTYHSLRDVIARSRKTCEDAIVIRDRVELMSDSFEVFKLIKPDSSATMRCLTKKVQFIPFLAHVDAKILASCSK